MTCAAGEEVTMTSMKKVALWVLGCTLWLTAEPVQLPCPCGPGTIVAFEKSTAAQQFVDFELAVKADQPMPADSRPDALLKSQPCPAGKVYLIFKVKVAEGRSLSKFDYMLETNTRQTLLCREMGHGEADFFDFRLKAQTGPGDYRLIFECPKDVYEVKLCSSFLSVGLPPVGDFVVNERPEGAFKDAPGDAAKDVKDVKGAP